MRVKSVVMDDKTMKRALIRMSHEIIERYHGVGNVCLVGIRRRGVPLARTIALIIEQVEGTALPVGMLDITHYRDDLSELGDMPTINASDIPFDVTGKQIVLVDDVIYTGRTCRAAIDAVFELGRPAATGSFPSSPISSGKTSRRHTMRSYPSISARSTARQIYRFWKKNKEAHK